MTTDDKSRPRRLRRGHSKSEPEVSVALTRPPIPKRVDPEAFRRVDAMLAGFAQNRFGKVMPLVAQGFFGAAKEGEVQDPQLQAAFASFFVYGWHDEEQRRIVDMFAEFGLPPESPLQQTALDALRHTRQVLFQVEEGEPANKQMMGRDLVRDEALIVLDHAAFETLSPGDALLSYYFPTGSIWRPLGVGTQVYKARVDLVVDALRRLADGREVAFETLSDQHPDQVFWLVYRTTNLMR